MSRRPGPGGGDTLNPETERTVRRLADRAEIHDVLMRYFRGVDRLDLELVRSCYHADATDSHGSFTGSVDEYLAWVGPLLAGYDSTFHFAGNLLVDIADNAESAATELYGIAHHRTAGADRSNDLITGFRFIDRFERRCGGAWLIARRLATTEWVRVDDQAGWFDVPSHFRSGSRDGTDPVFDA
jgi:hypothetical protein